MAGISSLTNSPTWRAAGMIGFLATIWIWAAPDCSSLNTPLERLRGQVSELLHRLKKNTEMRLAVDGAVELHPPLDLVRDCDSVIEDSDGICPFCAEEYHNQMQISCASEVVGSCD